MTLVESVILGFSIGAPIGLLGALGDLPLWLTLTITLVTTGLVLTLVL